MVGLAASELAASTRSAGEIVEYYSFQHVCGDPRGHRVAVVLRVNTSNDEYPLSLDTGEMLPKQGWLRKMTKAGTVDTQEKWRKLQTFNLMESVLGRPTRANEFCRALRAIAKTPIGGLLLRDPANSNARDTSFPRREDLNNDSEGCVSRNAASSGTADIESGSLNEPSDGRVGILLRNTVEKNVVLQNTQIVKCGSLATKQQQ